MGELNLTARMRIDYVIIFLKSVSSGFREDPALVRRLSKSDVMCCPTEQ